MSVDLSKLQHNDQCRYWDDGEFCTCGADTYEELKEVRAKVEQLERSNKELREALLKVARMAEALKRPCGMDPESPQAIRNGEYMNISYVARAALSAADANKGKENG